MSVIDPSLPVRERILAAASDLFYRQGYRATGINQVIEVSGVAKASFYDHFPSKQDLLYAYLRRTASAEIVELRSVVEREHAARERFLAPLRSLRPWFESTGYRGCPFQNIVSEAPPEDPRVQEVARQHRENLRMLLEELSRDLLRGTAAPSDPRAAERLAASYLLLLEGAIAVAVAYAEPWPIDKAMRTLLQLAGIDERAPD